MLSTPAAAARFQGFLSPADAALPSQRRAFSSHPGAGRLRVGCWLAAGWLSVGCGPRSRSRHRRGSAAAPPRPRGRPRAPAPSSAPRPRVRRRCSPARDGANDRKEPDFTHPHPGRPHPARLRSAAPPRLAPPSEAPHTHRPARPGSELPRTPLPRRRPSGRSASARPRSAPRPAPSHRLRRGQRLYLAGPPPPDGEEGTGCQARTVRGGGGRAGGRPAGVRAARWRLRRY